MSIVRENVTTTNTNVPCTTVHEPDTNIPITPVEGFGGGTQPVLESISITENGNYTPPEGVDGYNNIEVDVSISPVGEIITSAQIVESIPVPVAPEVLPEGKLYIIPKGQQVIPPIPVDLINIHSVICANTFNIQSDYDYITYEEVLNATKFWLYTSDIVPKTRRDQISKITWGNNATTSVAPTKIYEYDTTGTFEWVDISNDPDTVSNFENDLISHDVRDCLYSDSVIYRFTVGNPQYLIELNKVDSNCRINNIYYIDYFDCYIVENGVAVYDDTYNMYQIISNYVGGIL